MAVLVMMQDVDLKIFRHGQLVTLESQKDHLQIAKNSGRGSIGYDIG